MKLFDHRSYKAWSKLWLCRLPLALIWEEGYHLKSHNFWHNQCTFLHEYEEQQFYTSPTWVDVSWLAPSWWKGGVCNVAPRLASKSSMLKPQSAMILSPGSTRLRKSQCSVMCRSDVRPPQIWETHTTVHLWSPVLSVHSSNPKSSTLWVFGKTGERNT